MTTPEQKATLKSMVEMLDGHCDLELTASGVLCTTHELDFEVGGSIEDMNIFQVEDLMLHIQGEF